MANLKGNLVGNYPRMFFGKDASNLPKQPTLFEMMDEAEELIRLLRVEIENAEIDLRFLMMMLAENQP